jgi:hypothetical protein
MKKTLAILAVSSVVGVVAQAAVIEQWDMNGNGQWQNSNNGLNIGGHYNTNNHTLAQTADDGTFLFAPATLPQGFGGKTALSSAIDLTAGVVTLSMAFTDVNWSGTPGSNNNISFRLWEHGNAGADYVGVTFYDNGDRIRSRVEDSVNGNNTAFGRYGADLTASGAYNAVVEIDYANNEIRLSGAWDWAPGGATTQTNSFDFAAAGFTSIGNFQTRYSNWSAGDTMLVDDITISQIPEPATLGLVAAFGGAIMFIRRQFMV